MIGPANIIAYAGQFSELPVEKIQLYIGYAKLSVPEKKWGVKYDFGLLLLTCHLLTLAILQEMAMEKGALGPVTSETLGDSSRSFGGGGGESSGVNGDSLNQTSYGREFLRLQRSLVKTPFVVMCK